MLRGVCNVMNIEIMSKNNFAVEKKILLKTVKMTISSLKLLILIIYVLSVIFYVKVTSKQV